MTRDVNDARMRWDANGMKVRYGATDEEWCFYAPYLSDMTCIHIRPCVLSIKRRHSVHHSFTVEAQY